MRDDETTDAPTERCLILCCCSDSRLSSKLLAGMHESISSSDPVLVLHYTRNLDVKSK